MDERLVRKAFQEILEREPDMDGLQFYAKKEVTYNRLCALLRESPEYRKKEGVSKSEDASKKGVELPWPLPQVFVARNMQVAYCPIAKSGCSTFKRLLVQISDIEDREALLRRGDIHKQTDRYNTGIQLKDLSADEVERVLGSKKYFRFAVVRDPAERLLSAYWEKFVKNRHSVGNLEHTRPVLASVLGVKEASGSQVDSGISFRAFVEHVISQNPYDLDPHWRPQYLYLERFEWDELYSLKNVGALYEKISALCGYNVEPERQNVTNSGVGVRCPGAELMDAKELARAGSVDKDDILTPELRGMIEGYYERDYELMRKCR